MAHTDPQTSPDVITGWRHARLVVVWRPGAKRPQQMGFASLNQADLWGRDAEAVCRRHPVEHHAPEPGCKCGFYSKADRAEIMRGEYPGQLSRDRTVVLCAVRLSGNIIEGETGWRASHQRVENVIVDQNCAQCGQPSTKLAVNPDPGSGLFITAEGAWAYVSAYCDSCAPTHQISFEEAAAMLGADVAQGQVHDDAEGEPKRPNPFGAPHWQNRHLSPDEERREKFRRGVGSFNVAWVTVAAAIAAAEATKAGWGAELWVGGGKPAGAELPSAHLLLWVMALCWGVTVAVCRINALTDRPLQLAEPNRWWGWIWGKDQLRLAPPNAEQRRQNRCALASAAITAVSVYLAGGVGLIFIAAAAAAAMWAVQRSTRQHIMWTLTTVAAVGFVYLLAVVPHTWTATAGEAGVTVELLAESEWQGSSVGAVKAGHYIAEGRVQLVGVTPELAEAWGLADGSTCALTTPSEEPAGGAKTYHASSSEVIAAWKTEDGICRRGDRMGEPVVERSRR